MSFAFAFFRLFPETSEEEAGCRIRGWRYTEFGGHGQEGLHSRAANGLWGGADGVEGEER